MKKSLAVFGLLLLGAGCLRFTSEPNQPIVELEPSADYYVNPDAKPDPEANPGIAPGEPNPNGEEQPICINTCGNGTCEEIVCLGSGCPCAETPESCPDDCR